MPKGIYKRTKTTKKIVEPTSRFLIIKLDCMNFEGSFPTLEEATEEVDRRRDEGDWEQYELDYVRIVKVVNVHLIETIKIQAIPTDLSDLE